MADGGQDESQKTEEPTHKRLQDALKRGQVVNSREVTSFLMLLVLTATLAWILPYAMGLTHEWFGRFITTPHDFTLDVGNLHQLMADIFLDMLLIFLLIVSAGFIAALVGSFIQHGLVISGEPMKPKAEKISPLKGLKRMFSLKSVMEFVKGVFKITIIGTVAYIAAAPYLGFLKQLPNYDIADLMVYLDHVALRMMIGVCIVMAFIAGLDYLYQRYEYLKSLRMSHQEIKDEFKQMEGDPQVKAKIRQIRMERAQNRMMANVPEADVVITNPTHYAVALAYQTGAMGAPKVVAKGQDHIAMVIREIATEHDIPIVENPPLARGIFNAVELEDEIPTAYYQAVAEIISYVYRLKGKLPGPAGTPPPVTDLPELDG